MINQKDFLNKEIIYLDKEGYELHLQSIENLKRNLLILETNISTFNISKDNIDAYNELKLLRENIAERIMLLSTKTKNITVIENENNDDILDVNDTVLVNMIFSETDQEKFQCKIVGKNDVHSDELVSVNSPLGKALYKSKVGDTVYYNLKNEKVTVEILEKVKTKKLVK